MMENPEYKTLEDNVEKGLQQQSKINQISKFNREHKKIQSKPGCFADYAKRFSGKRGVEDISNTNKNRNGIISEEE